MPTTELAPLAADSAVVLAVTGLVVEANETRTGLVLTNVSTAWISIGLGEDAVLDFGICLAPDGGMWVMDEFTFTLGEINAIAEDTDVEVRLAIQEFGEMEV